MKNIKPNRLIDETSPYLRLHAYNPVDWYPWSEEALKKAEDENKLLIISIGYAACHWCHVMEYESYNKQDVANVMNKDYVSIKIDREERPDLDSIYMNAAHLLTGQGGWPLNVIALPDGRPVYAGTYFPRVHWIDVLQQLTDLYKEKPEKLNLQAERLTEGIKSMDIIPPSPNKFEFTKKDIEDGSKTILQLSDYVGGGIKGAPKFPMPAIYKFLLMYHDYTGNTEALSAIKSTLDNMAYGGIYDQVGGGFARYSVDNMWKVPHFEKMLYDNAQLVSLYSQAYQLTKNEMYKEVVYETLGFIEREMSSPDGGFYSSYDADSDGEEGRFYVWTKSEIKDVCREDANLILDYYSILEEGNWEKGKNILLKKMSDSEFAEVHGIEINVLKEKVANAKASLFEYRENRVKPALDDKILTEWNALMIIGYVDAYNIFCEEKFLLKALSTAHFIIDNVCKDERLFRSYKNGEAKINGFLDDYAFTIEAFIKLYQVTFNEFWLTYAKKFTEFVQEHYFDAESGLYFYTSNEDPELITRKVQIDDNVIPSGNSTMVWNLFVLGKLTDNESLVKSAEKMIHTVKEKIGDGVYYANWLYVLTFLLSRPFEVVIVGEKALDYRKKLGEYFMPNVIYAGSTVESDMPLIKNKFNEFKTTIFVCKNKVCLLPTDDTENVFKLVRGE